MYLPASLLLLLLGNGLLFRSLHCSCFKQSSKTRSDVLEVQASSVRDVPTCRASLEGDEVKILTHTPDVSQTPASLDAALQIPINEDSGNCYNNKSKPETDNGLCCCSFWEIPPSDPAAALAAQDREACGQTFAKWKTGENPHRMDKASCRIAIALSGIVGRNPKGVTSTLDNAKKVFQSLEEHVIGQRKDVCVVVFAGVSHDDGAGIKDLLDSKSYVVDWSLEVLGETDAQVNQAASACSEGTLSKIGDEWNKRYKQGPPYSAMYMFRKIWLAHKLARALNDNLKLIVRGRIDGFHSASIDWDSYLQKTNLVIAEPNPWLYLKRRRGVDLMKRCITDDQFALGPPAVMDSYASVYPSLNRLAKYLLTMRRDSWGHFNERLLRLNLHFRGVNFETTPGIVQAIHYQ